jgi:4,5-DOPA dioxygenase extradiol
MFPDADVPVVPLSIQHNGGPAHAYRVGQALAPLTQQGFLVVGSGNVTHNLRDWQLSRMTGQPTPDYVHDFADWVHIQMRAHQVDALLNYRQTQASGVRAHPRDEHLLPLFTALGAAGTDAQPEAFYRGIDDHVIAMDGYAFH